MGHGHDWSRVTPIACILILVLITTIFFLQTYHYPLRCCIYRWMSQVWTPPMARWKYDHEFPNHCVLKKMLLSSSLARWIQILTKMNKVTRYAHDGLMMHHQNALTIALLHQVHHDFISMRGCLILAHDSRTFVEWLQQFIGVNKTTICHHFASSSPWHLQTGEPCDSCSSSISQCLLK